MDIHNGILLCKDLHSLNPYNTTIEIHPDYIKKDSSLCKINGKKILYVLPPKTIDILKHHSIKYKNIIISHSDSTQ